MTLATLIQTLGGWLSEHHPWRRVFYINVPIGALTTVWLLSRLPETPVDPTRRFDAAGFAFLAIALGSLQLMLDRGETLDWFTSREVVAEAALAEHVDPSRLPLRLAVESGAWRLDTAEGLAAVQAEVARQAATIAFLQDFRMIAWVCVATAPLVLLMRRPAAR